MRSSLAPEGSVSPSARLQLREVDVLAPDALTSTARDALAIRIAACCGLRGGDVGGLQVDDVEFDECYITVRRTTLASVGDNGITVGPPKSTTSERRLKVPCYVTDSIREYLTANPANAHGFIFSTNQGSPCTSQVFTDATVRAARAAGLQRVTFHDLRHTRASLLIQDRQEPKAIHVYLGHATLAMTFDVYGHLFPGPTSRSPRACRPPSTPRRAWRSPGA
jgi:integrase